MDQASKSVITNLGLVLPGSTKTQIWFIKKKKKDTNLKGKTVYAAKVNFESDLTPNNTWCELLSDVNFLNLTISTQTSHWIVT